MKPRRQHLARHYKDLVIPSRWPRHNQEWQDKRDWYRWLCCGKAGTAEWHPAGHTALDWQIPNVSCAVVEDTR